MLDACAVSASSSVSTLPPSNLKVPVITQRFRTVSGVTTFTLNFDFGSAQTIGVLALQQPQDAGGVDADNNPTGFMASTDTVRHRLDLVTPGAGSVLDTGTIQGKWVSGYGTHYYVLTNSVSARYWQCDIAAASLVSLGYVDIGLAWAGPSLRPTYNMVYGAGFGWEEELDLGVQSRSLIEFVDDTANRRVVNFGLDALSEAEAKTSLFEMQRIAGRQNQILFIHSPEDTTYGNQLAMIGRLQETNPIAQPYFQNFTRSFQIRESR